MTRVLYYHLYRFMSSVGTRGLSAQGKRWDKPTHCISVFPCNLFTIRTCRITQYLCNFSQGLKENGDLFFFLCRKYFYSKTSEKSVMRWGDIPTLTYSHTGNTWLSFFVIKIKAKPAIIDTSDLQTLGVTFNNVACNTCWNHVWFFFF